MGPEVKRARRHFGKLKTRSGPQVGIAHGMDEFLRPGRRAEELILPLAGHVGEQQGEPPAGGQHLVGVGGRFVQHFGKPFGHNAVHFLGGNLGGGVVRLDRGALHGAFEHAEHQLAQQCLVANPQGVEIIFHLGVGGVPFFQRAAGQSAGDIGQRARAGHGGLHW